VVKDANNCSVTTDVTLSQPTASFSSSLAITSNYNGQHVSCFGSTNGSIAAYASNGTAPYTYTWSTTPVQTGSLAIGVGAGNYSVTMTDINGCNIINSITVSEPLQVNATTSVTSNYNGQNISCFGSTNGSASVITTGGTTPYTYLWNSIPSQTTVIASNLGAGSYNVIVTDVNGCTIVKTVTLIQPVKLAAQIIGLSLFEGYNVSCFQSTNGYIDVSVNGGTGSYSYIWSNSANTQDIVNLGAGNYSVVVSDINGCKDSLTSTITEPNKLIAIIDSVTNFNGHNVRCFGSKNGAIYVSVNGGVPNYNYTWSNNTTNQDLTNIGFGSYTLSVSDKNLCSTSIHTILTQPSALTFASSVTKPLCHGIKTGAIDITIGGGIIPYSYNWSNNASTQDINNISAGSYEIKYIDKNGCKDSAVINVSQPDPFVLTKVVDNLKCNGDTIGNIYLTTNGATAPYNYQWSNQSSTKDLNNIGSGEYSTIITDANNCVYNDTTKITQPDALQITISSTRFFNGHNISLFNGNDGSIYSNITGGSAPYRFLWSEGSSSQNLFNLTAGNYYITCSDTNGCRISATIALTEPLPLEMPQGFSPNSDGKNELFVVHGIEAYPDNVLNIYNRWGNIIYSKIGYLNDWDGTSNNGLALPDATYFAILEINKSDIVLKGYVELRR
jgi:gliding motility-associated-like protein